MASKHFLAVTLAFVVANAFCAGQESAPPPVRVEFIHPEKFADVGDSALPSDKARAAYLENLGNYLVRRAAPRLPQGQVLTVAITDVDMAGDFEPWRPRLGNTRIIRDVYPPRIDLRFTLTSSDGTVTRQGERKLRDIAFMTSSSAYHNDALRYEKALIDDWLEREFPAPATHAPQ